MTADTGSALAAEAARFAGMFGLRPAGARRVASGSDRHNYALALPGGGRAFLRIYPPGEAASPACELHLAEHLSARGVPTPVPLPLAPHGDGWTATHEDVPLTAHHGPGASPRGAGRIATHDGRCAVLLPWIEGDVLCARAVHAGHARLVGAALARFHLAGASFPRPPAPRFGPAELAHILESGVERSAGAEAAEAARALAARLAAWEQDGPLAETGLVHGDLFRENILWRGPEIAAVLDLESASRGSLAWDLMIAVLAWCFGDDLDLRRARALVRAYSEIRPLSPDDLRDLHRAARLAALRFAITRLVTFGTGPGGPYHRDYRRFLARLDTIERIGDAAWPATLGLSPSTPG